MSATADSDMVRGYAAMLRGALIRLPAHVCHAYDSRDASAPRCVVKRTRRARERVIRRAHAFRLCMPRYSRHDAFSQ